MGNVTTSTIPPSFCQIYYLFFHIIILEFPELNWKKIAFKNLIATRENQCSKEYIFGAAL